MHNLPAQPMPLIGRLRELAAAKRMLLSEGVRLLTLTGPAGVGKTRLAVAAAEESLDSFPQGAWFVDLAPLNGPGAVPSAVARVLGVREAGDRPLTEILAEYLWERRMLLVLDNLEQLLPDAATTVAELLSACPNLAVLATSRERLRLRSERTFPVRFEDSRRLLEHGFAAYVRAVLVEKGERYARVEVPYRRGKEVDLTAGHDVEALIHKVSEVEREVEMIGELPDSADPGARLGEVSVRVGGEPVGESPLVARGGYDEASPWDRAWYALEGLWMEG